MAVFNPIKEISELQEIARKARINIVKMLAEAASGHPGGSLSACDVMTVLLFSVMRHDPENPLWEDRDRFVLSKGHCVPAWYALLAEAGYFPKEKLMTLRKLDSPLQGHPDRVMLDCMEASTGSLGQGLSIAMGMALANQLDRKTSKVYCMLGDGEIQEGQVWEAILAAPKFKLDNLITILDYNKAQIDGFVSEVMPLEPIVDKIRSFNWHVISINGHDLQQITDAFTEAQSVKGKPVFIVADTVKGKGVSFMEGLVDWHGKAPSQEEAEKAVAELAAV